MLHVMFCSVSHRTSLIVSMSYFSTCWCKTINKTSFFCRLSLGFLLIMLEMLFSLLQLLSSPIYIIINYYQCLLHITSLHLSLVCCSIFLNNSKHLRIIADIAFKKTTHILLLTHPRRYYDKLFYLPMK